MKMDQPYLEVTFLKGRAFAAYYYLPREAEARSSSTRRVEPAMVVDFDAQGAPIGIEITTPVALTLVDFNRVLAELGQSPVDEQTLKPLHAA